MEARQKQLDRVRWALVAVVILLLAAGLYYYYINLPGYDATSHSGGGQGEGGRERASEGGGREKEGRKKTKKDSPTAQVAGKKKPKRNSEGATSDNKAAKGAGKKPDKRGTKPKTGQSVPSIGLDDLRLLRRPIPPEDSDRPYIIEILNGDNLLLEQRYSLALEKFNEILKMFPQSPRGLFGKGETLYGLAVEKSSNKLRDTAIEFYEEVAQSLLTPHAIKVRRSGEVW